MTATKVIVAEREGPLRNLIAESLFQRGLKVFQAVDGVEALRLLQGQPDVSLLLVGVNLPRMNGHEVVESSLKLIPGLKVLMVAEHAEELAVPAELRAREIKILTKPLCSYLLTELVIEMLAKH